jgi:hypothetical protein
LRSTAVNPQYFVVISLQRFDSLTRATHARVNQPPQARLQP